MKKSILIGLLLAFTLISNAQSANIYSTKNGALDGYDPVAFFTENKPVKGERQFSYNWQGADWFFSSKVNLDSFSKFPLKYAPQYGGYCAFGISDGEGHKAPTKPETWTITNAKLYLNYNLQVKSLWLKNRDELIKIGDGNWEKVSGGR